MDVGLPCASLGWRVITVPLKVYFQCTVFERNYFFEEGAGFLIFWRVWATQLMRGMRNRSGEVEKEE
jgi:hypothetical protein